MCASLNSEQTRVYPPINVSKLQHRQAKECYFRLPEGGVPGHSLDPSWFPAFVGDLSYAMVWLSPFITHPERLYHNLWRRLLAVVEQLSGRFTITLMISFISGRFLPPNLILILKWQQWGWSPEAENKVFRPDTDTHREEDSPINTPRVPASRIWTQERFISPVNGSSP